MFILADDLSGASDCAIASITSGLTATVALGDLPHDLPAHVISIDCNTRHLGPVTAADKTIHLLHRYHPSPDCLLFKKLDSTLRGNVAAELTAVLAFRRSSSANPTQVVAVLAPPSPPAAAQQSRDTSSCTDLPSTSPRFGGTRNRLARPTFRRFSPSPASAPHTSTSRSFAPATTPSAKP